MTIYYNWEIDKFSFVFLLAVHGFISMFPLPDFVAQGEGHEIQYA